MSLLKLNLMFFSPLDVLDEDDDSLFELVDIIPDSGLDTVFAQMFTFFIINNVEIDDILWYISVSEGYKAKDFDGWDEDNEWSQGWAIAGNMGGLLPFSSPLSADVFYVLSGCLGSFICGMITFCALKGLRVMYFFVPLGAPWSFMILITFVDFVSHFARVVSLSIRLIANVTAGHALLKIIFGFCWDFFTTISMFSIFGIFPGILFFMIVGLEIFIALLQAYIFSVLNGAYQAEITN